MTGTEGELEALLAFLYAAPVGLVRAAEDGSIEIVNGAAMRLMLPVVAERSRLSNLFDALATVAPDLRALAQQPGLTTRALVEGRRLCLQGPGQRPETALHASLSLYRLGGNGLMAVLTDITEQAHGELALRAGEARLRFLLDTAAIGDWDLDLDSGALQVQGAFAQCLGQPDGTAPWTLERLFQALHDEDRDAAYAAFDRALLSGEAWRIEARLAPAGNAERWLMLHGRAVPGVGGTAVGRRMLGMVQDITDRRAAERARLDLTRMADEKRLVEQSARMRTEFLARMSHEFRTPLNAIVGLAQVLGRRLQQPADRQSVEQIQRAGTHLAGMVDDVLDLAKVDAGELCLRPAPFELDAMLSGALEMVAASARRKGLALVLEASGLPSRWVGDAGRLKQALINLLANAVRFTERGQVVLRVTPATTAAGAPALRFEVEDTGPGIAEEVQARLFQPYVQLADGVPGGTGLGLAVTRQIARLMGGDAGVLSQPGAGSRFWFTAVLEAADAAPVEPDAAFVGRRVLLVDEQAVARDATAAQLRALGLQVDAESNGPAALATAALAVTSRRAHAAFIVAAGAGATLGLLRRHFGSVLPPLLRLVDDLDSADTDRAPAVVRPTTTTALRAALLALLHGSADAPLATPQAPSAEQQLLRRHAGRRVLVVEDNLINREVAYELLIGAGLLVDLADDGAQGVEKASSVAYDLVLMDMQMPVMDGLVATRLLRERLGPGLPIIGFSANAYAEDRDECFAAGMNDYLAKPVDAGTLFACVLRWLERG